VERVDLSTMAKRIACLTMVRDETVALQVWYRYYATVLGHENLFVIDHNSKNYAPRSVIGEDRRLNVFRIPFDNHAGHIEGQRSFDAIRFTFASQIMSGLLKYYDMVLFTDTDEIFVPDPEKYNSLREYLERSRRDVVAGVGIEIFHDPSIEAPFDARFSVLEQRSNFTYKFHYSKPHIVAKPCRIGPHGSSLPFYIDPDLYLLHLKYLDWDLSLSRQSNLFDCFSEGRGGFKALWRFNVEETKEHMKATLALPRRKGFEHKELFDSWLGGHTDLIIDRVSEPKPGQANVIQLVDRLPPAQVRAAERVRRTLPDRFRAVQV
jgi:hypothetical protein